MAPAAFEKIRLGWEMSNKLTDPAIILILLVGVAPVAAVLVTVLCLWYLGLVAGLTLVAAGTSGLYFWYHNVWLQDGPAPIDNYVEFKDEATKRTWSGRRIPIADCCLLYLEDKIAFKMDVLEVLRDHRNEFVNYKFTWTTYRFLFLQLFPNQENSTGKDLKATKKEIAEHYDRGNDWFGSFLGPRMVYTSAVFEGLDQSLETAQDNKMSLICEKIMLKDTETMLDIGCGWGTLTRHAARHFGAKAIGVTLSVQGEKYCKEQAKKEGLEGRAEVMRCDYREIPAEMKFDKITAIEMAEHVGLENFPLFLTNVKSMMKDDGMFLMQVAGLRQGSNWEDLAWGLFMSRYIFPGADASTPCHWYIRQLEMAGFEVHSTENIGRHYSHTLWRWYNHFQQNREEMHKTYGGYLCRLWDFFLAWSVVAAGQGSATCYQFVCHKNAYDFDRDVFCEQKVARTSVGVKGFGSK
jgi:cyclopropane fatty-acyl-phospholipid synthase-like methyltransferase